MGRDADRRGGSVGSGGQALLPGGLLVGFLRKGEVRVFGSEELGDCQDDKRCEEGIR